MRRKARAGLTDMPSMPWHGPPAPIKGPRGDKNYFFIPVLLW